MFDGYWNLGLCFSTPRYSFVSSILADDLETQFAALREEIRLLRNAPQCTAKRGRGGRRKRKSRAWLNRRIEARLSKVRRLAETGVISADDARRALDAKR